MAITVSFGFTNTTAQTNAVVTGKKLGMVSNYAPTAITADNYACTNTTAPVNAEELVSYRSREIKKVNTDLNLEKPSAIKKAIEYGPQTQTTAIITDSVTGEVINEPIVITTTIRHNKNAALDGNVIKTLFERHVSTMYDDNGNERFTKLMRSCEQPTNN